MSGVKKIIKEERERWRINNSSGKDGDRLKKSGAISRERKKERKMEKWKIMVVCGRSRRTGALVYLFAHTKSFLFLLEWECWRWSEEQRPESQVES